MFGRYKGFTTTSKVYDSVAMGTVVRKVQMCKDVRVCENVQSVCRIVFQQLGIVKILL